MTAPQSSPHDSKTCPNCKAVLQQTVAFCPFCGAAIPPAAPEPAPVADPIKPEPPKAAAPKTEPPKPATPTIAVPPPRLPPPRQPQVPTPTPPWLKAVIGIAAVVLLLVAAGSILMSQRQPTPPTVTVYTNHQVYVRDQPSASGNVVALLPVGTSLHGQWAKSPDGSERWLHLSDGPYSGNYVWDGNLQSDPYTPPPDTPSPAPNPPHDTTPAPPQQQTTPDVPPEQDNQSGNQSGNQQDAEPSPPPPPESSTPPDSRKRLSDRKPRPGSQDQDSSAVPPPRNQAAGVQPSFDCRVTNDPSARLVCATPRLIELDNQLSDLYRRYLAVTPAHVRRQVILAQRQWMADRLQCMGRSAPESCIETLYRKRIAVLSMTMPGGQGSGSSEVAPGFDCNRANGDAAAALVCGSPKLAELDAELSRVYRSFLNSTMDVMRDDVIQSQRDWIGRRQRCLQSWRPADCVESLYRQRIADLRAGRPFTVH